ncbi:hypothetical protein D1872_50440 [compost metagenome]
MMDLQNHKILRKQLVNGLSVVANNQAGYQTTMSSTATVLGESTAADGTVSWVENSGSVSFAIVSNKMYKPNYLYLRPAATVDSNNTTGQKTLAVSPDGTFFVTYTTHNIKVYTIESHTGQAELYQDIAVESDIQVLALSPDSTYMAVSVISGGSYLVLLYKRQGATFIQTGSLLLQANVVNLFFNLTGSKIIALSSTGAFIITRSFDTLNVNAPNTVPGIQKIAKIKHNSNFTDLYIGIKGISPQYVVALDLNGTTLSNELELPADGTVVDLDVSPDGSYICVVTSGVSQDVHLIRRASNNLLTRVSSVSKLPNQTIKSCYWSPEGTTLLMGKVGTGQPLHLYDRMGDLIVVGIQLTPEVSFTSSTYSQAVFMLDGANAVAVYNDTTTGNHITKTMHNESLNKSTLPVMLNFRGHRYRLIEDLSLR